MLSMTKDEIRKAWSEAHTAWWRAYNDMQKNAHWDRSAQPNVRVYDNPAMVENERLLREAWTAIETEGIRLYAHAEVKDCPACERNSVFGGPGHYASPNCRSGRKPHCTCDTCF